MGFDLRPRNKAAGDFSIGAFSWPWMLEAGVGLPLGYGKGFSPGQFLTSNRKDGLCVAYNDGAHVSAAEAKQMAQLARWVADFHDSKHAMWADLPEIERERMGANRDGLYSLPVRQDFIEKTRAFAAWAVMSGGFRVW